MDPLILRVERQAPGVSCTLGRLLLAGAPFCNTLEDLVREVPGVPVEQWKIPGETAIPAGEYEILLTVSERAMRGHLWTPAPDFVLPELIGVPGFAGVRIHAGNTALNVEGCIAVGTAVPAGESLVNSRAALIELMSQLRAADVAGTPMRIEVVNP